MIRKKLIVASIALCGLADPLAAQPPRPNIVIILVDDMGYSDIGCYGGEIETPHIDALANRGLRFTQFYNCGRCCPTRASLMTGLYPHQVGIGHMTEPPERPLGFAGPYQGYLNHDCTTLAQVLSSAGYHTLMTGKWHLGLHLPSTWPAARGFDKFYGCLSGAINYFKPGGNRGLVRQNEHVEPPDDFYATDDFTDAAMDYITAASADERPFFLYLAYNAPHWPLNAKWEDYQKYRGTYLGGWEKLMERRFARQMEIGMWAEGVTPAPHVGPDWDSLSQSQHTELDSIMAAYAGCVDSIDQNVGKLVAHLDSLGVYENTVIFFLSDNGACQEGGKLGHGNEAMIKDPPLETTRGVRLGLAWANASNTPFRLYKHFVHEGGACTPLVVSWPAGIADRVAGQFARQVAYLPDFMATCLELSGARYPAHRPAHHGASLVPILRGSEEPIHIGPLYWEHEGNAAMRWGDWKLVREYQQPWELYNLAEDRTEMHNLADTHPQQRDLMIARWEEWATEHQVAFPERFNMYQFLSEEAKREEASADANSP